MQGPLERMDNSPGMLAGVGAAVLVVVALGVFAFGSMFGGGDDSTSASGATETDGSDSGELTGSDGQLLDEGDGTGDNNNDSAGNSDNAGDNDSAGGNDSDNNDDSAGDDGASDGSGSGDNGSGDDASDGSDYEQSTDTTGSDDDTPATTESGGDSDFCEASTRNNFTIRFASGASSAEQTNTVGANEVDLHKLDVDQGQILTVNVEAGGSSADIEIMAPNGSIVGAGRAPYNETISPTNAGTYQICATPRGQTVTYTLTVSVISDNSPTKISATWCGDSVNDRGEIRFTAGSTSGTVAQAVIRGERDLYSFEAGEGQDLDVALTSLEDNAEFTLRSPSGDIIIDGVSDFRIPLPESGDYLICIGGTRGNASYTLSTTIK